MTHYHSNDTVTTYKRTLEYANEKPYDFTLIRGVLIVYPCGTIRWISDTWYSDINVHTL